MHRFNDLLMVALFPLFLFVYAVHSYEHLHRVFKPNEDILPFTEHPDEALEYAKTICNGFLEFLGSDGKQEEYDAVAAFEAVWGNMNDVLHEHIVSKDFDKPAITGFVDNRRTFMMIRTIATQSVSPDVSGCDFSDFEVGPYWFKYEHTKYVTILDLVTSLTAMTGTATLHFNKDDRTVKTFITNSNERPNQSHLRRMIDLSLGMSTTVYNAAVYLKLIEAELENENQSLIMIKQIFCVIMGCIALFVVVIISLFVQYVLTPFGKNRIKYKTISVDDPDHGNTESYH